MKIAQLLSNAVPHTWDEHRKSFRVVLDENDNVPLGNKVIVKNQYMPSYRKISGTVKSVSGNTVLFPGSVIELKKTNQRLTCVEGTLEVGGAKTGHIRDRISQRFKFTGGGQAIAA